ncbi:hypothetical protein L1987_30714 [Smallanthus sonchifolius]|uniref:Uncharacterized protein n=1 Tax=Smallanthus sonchifolius TaxID=185202 RepID=A0ACB9I4W4_9ASTR|nr:hypothetical protein L1987_30714 [Smallanthus sonchifolius]
MKSKRLGFLFLLLCAHFISSLDLGSKGKEVPVDMNGNSHHTDDGVKHDELVMSKEGKGKGAYGGENNRPPSTKKSKATSMFLNIPNVVISVIITNIILVFYF